MSGPRSRLFTLLWTHAGTGRQIGVNIASGHLHLLMDLLAAVSGGQAENDASGQVFIHLPHGTLSVIPYEPSGATS